MNDKKSSRKKRSRFYAFLGGVVALLLFLIASTTLSTLNQIWIEEGRIHDTKTEYFIAHFVGGMRTNLITSGHDPESWYIKLLDDVDKWAYSSAVKKLPENDFENEFWYYHSYFQPIANGSEAYIKKNLDQLVPAAANGLEKINDYDITSDVDRDIYYHEIINYYARIYFYYARDYDSKLYGSVKGKALETVCKNALTINPRNVLSYNMRSYNGVIFWSLAETYIYLKDNWQVDGQCVPEIAKCWQEVSQKTQDILIKDEKAVSVYLTGDYYLQARANFRKFFPSYDEEIRKQIKNKCTDL